MEKKKKKKEPRAAFFYALVKQCGLLVCVERVTCVEKKKKKMTLMKLGARRFCKGKKKKIMAKQQKKKKRALRMQAQSTSTHSLCLLRFFSFFFSVFLSFLSHICLCFCLSKKNNTKAKVLQTHRLEAIIMYIVARERPSFTYTWCNTNSRLQSSFFFFFRGQNCRQPIKKKKKRELRCI